MVVSRETLLKLDDNHDENVGIFTKVSFKRCATNDKIIFPIAKCIIPVSVGVKIHEDEKFLATMKLINSSFKSCVLLIDDSIQKYTLKIDEPDVSLDNLYVKAINEGSEWLERNRQAYESLTIPYQIMRWDEWKNHKNFEQAYKNIEVLYNADEQYKQAIHTAIEEFMHRHTAHNLLSMNIFDEAHTFNCCLQYLKEECAVMCLWAEEKFDFEVYPSGRNKAMIATYDKLIKPMHPCLLKSVSLYFEKRIKYS